MCQGSTILPSTSDVATPGRADGLGDGSVLGACGGQKIGRRRSVPRIVQ